MTDKYFLAVNDSGEWQTGHTSYEAAELFYEEGVERSEEFDLWHFHPKDVASFTVEDGDVCWEWTPSHLGEEPHKVLARAELPEQLRLGRAHWYKGVLKVNRSLKS